MERLNIGDATTCDLCGVSGPYSDQPGEGITHGADGHTMTCDDCAAQACVTDGVHSDDCTVDHARRPVSPTASTATTAPWTTHAGMLKTGDRRCSDQGCVDPMHLTRSPGPSCAQRLVRAVPRDFQGNDDDWGA